MARRMVFGTFTKFNLSHYQQGSWRLPEYARGNREYQSIDSWIEIARLSEEAKMDFLMWADDLGVGGYYDGDRDEGVRNGIAAVMDNSTLAAALSTVTKYLGLVVTSSTVQDHPFHFARRMSTLDWLTSGRLGWNIVTGVSPGMFQNFGIPMPDHDQRYEHAHEYMDVLYKLWEGSWDRDAPVHSIEQNVWADPTKVRTIDHESAHFSVKGPHQVEPSPQGSPVLFQAGTSPQGTEFAARHAEVQFIGGGLDIAATAAYMNKVRAAVESYGRDPDTLMFAPALSIIVGETEADAQRKLAMILDSLDLNGIGAKLNGAIGIDVSDMDRRVDLAALKTEGIVSFIDHLRKSFPEGYQPTLNEMLRVQEEKKFLVGTPDQIADHIEQLNEAGAGALLVHLISRPGTLKDFVEMVAPELKRRGLMQTEYDPARRTLRDRIFGDGDVLPGTHTGSSYRSGAFARR